MVNTPIPHSLKSEAKKAAKILREFSVPSAKVGPDKLIPAGILMKAKGLAILTVVKAGFLVTARGGSGVVIAKLDDSFSSEWSAPSAIGIAGLGGGFEIGAEVTDFVIILNKRSAVSAFSKGGNLTLGGNFTVAAGPLGRNLEADVALRSAAAIYTYSKTRGLFAGISVEGSALIERKDANRKFYGQDIRAFEILRGDVEPPEECACLYEVLEMHKKNAQKQLVKMAKQEAMKAATGDSSSLVHRFSAFSRKSKKGEKSSSNTRQRYDSDSSDDFKPGSHHVTTVTKRTSTVTEHVARQRPKSSYTATSTAPAETATVGKKDSRGSRSSFLPSPGSRRDKKSKQHFGSQRNYGKSKGSSLTSLDASWDVHATALYTFKAQAPCDLSFKRGDDIEVLLRTDTQEDWWEGTCNGQTGIFPANYVRLKT